jgi:hypothetical protein
MDIITIIQIPYTVMNPDIIVDFGLTGDVAATAGSSA